jgi:hypothetical protein
MLQKPRRFLNCGLRIDLNTGMRRALAQPPATRQMHRKVRVTKYCNFAMARTARASSPGLKPGVFQRRRLG